MKALFLNKKRCFKTTVGAGLIQPKISGAGHDYCSRETEYAQLVGRNTIFNVNNHYGYPPWVDFQQEYR